MVHWDERFATGSSTLDQQHQVLINNVNHLGGMLANTNPTKEECEFLIHLVDFLKSYAQTHFQFEEQCMESYRCPAHARNKQAHEKFMMFINDFHEHCKVGGLRQENLKNLHATLSLWIEEHILQIDVQLKACIKN